MSYANGTPFLNLAQTVGTDHRDWFDENEAKLNLDTKMKTLWDGAADTATILAALQESVGELQTDVTTLEGVVSGHTSTITTINESLVLINTALNALNTQVTNKFDSAGIADPYDATHGTYDVGDVVTYNGQRYVCSTAVTAAEPFDVSKWTAEDVQTVLNSLIEVNASNVGTTYGDLITYVKTLPTGCYIVAGIDGTINHLSSGDVTASFRNMFQGNMKFYGIRNISSVSTISLIDISTTTGDVSAYTLSDTDTSPIGTSFKLRRISD